jgi:hypothetical protein
MAKVCRLLPLVAIVCMLFQPSVALAADSFTVYVGYADNLRAPSSLFPTPWPGSPNVVSQAPSAGTFDSGAVRIDNTGASPITITGFTVKFNGGSVVFNYWNPLTINPGQIGIFTQFDSSDFGIFGLLPPSSLSPTIPGNNRIGGCSSTASILAASGYAGLCAATAPVVSFMENGNPFSVTDTGHILDTGGWDFLYNSMFGGDGNESIPWNLIATVTNPPATSSFSAFCAELELSQEEPKEFELHAKFMLGTTSDGINPLTEDVTLKIGTFSTTIPAGSFHTTKNGGFHFEGEISGVDLDVRIKPLGDNSFTLKAQGKGVDLSALTNPVTVMLTIGNDTGTTAAFREEKEGEEGQGENTQKSLEGVKRPLSGVRKPVEGVKRQLDSVKREQVQGNPGHVSHVSKDGDY